MNGHTNGEKHEPWNQTPELENLARQDIWELRREFVNRLYSQVETFQVIDIGSGPGHDSLIFAQNGARVTALDYSYKALKLAKELYQRMGLPIRTIRADAGNIPLDRDIFDIAFSAGVLEHFTDRELEKVIDDMIRVVKPGGSILAFCPNRYNIFYQHHLKYIKRHRYEFERAFTAGEMCRRFECRGLKILRVSGIHVHPAVNYFLPEALPKYHRIEPAMRYCFSGLEKFDGLDRFKSLIGQDFVIVAEVPEKVVRKDTILNLSGGKVVRAASG